MKLFFLIENSTPLYQLIKYGIVGLSLNMVGYLTYLMVTYFGGEPKITMTVLFVIFTGIGFFSHGKLTFTSNLSHYKFIKYIIVYFLGYLTNLVLLFYFVDMMAFKHQVVQFIAMFIVALQIFIMLRLFVFRTDSVVWHDRGK